MRQFMTIFRFECKKIAGRTSTWVVLALLAVVYILFVILLPLAVVYSETSETEYGAGKSGEFSVSQMELITNERKWGRKLSGRSLDNELLEEWKEWQTEFDNRWNTMDPKARSLEIERYRMVQRAIQSLTGVGQENEETQVSAQENQPLAEREIYELNESYREQMYTKACLTAGERAYWTRQNDRLEKPMKLYYGEVYEEFTGTDIYLIFLLLTFWIGISISRIFAEEHSRRMDQIVLCSRHGRGMLYTAKILAGCLFTAIACILLLLLDLAVIFTLYQGDGFHERIQQIAGWYSYPLCMGQTMWIMIGLAFLGAIVTSLAVMLVTERFGNSMSGIAWAVAWMVIARIVAIPNGFRVLSQLWNYFPINMVNLPSGFLDLRLVSLGGKYFTSWQAAPVFYILVSVLLILWGKRLYCRYQVR